MKTRNLIGGLGVTLALAVATVAIASGCGGGTAVKEWMRTSVPATTYVCVIDVSQSTLDSRQTYVAALKRVLAAATYGDRVIVMSAERASVVDADLWVEQELPHFSFTPATPCPETDNDLLLDAWTDEQNQAYRAELAEFRKAHDLGKIRKDILARVRAHVLHDVSVGTDLFGALYVGGTLMTENGRNRVVMITDGLVQASGVNWRRGKVTTSSVNRLIKAQRRADELPDLHGADVILVGASTEAEDFAALRAAWCRYTRAASGRLESKYFMSKFSSTLFEEWAGADGGK